jgi:hypothetical protein
MSDVCRELGLGHQVNGSGHTELLAECLASVYMTQKYFLKKLQPGSNIDFEKKLNFN